MNFRRHLLHQLRQGPAPRPPWRHGLLLALLLLLLSLTAVPTAAQPASLPGLTLTAVAGYDGYYKAYGWLPVQITASNSGPAVSGQLRIITGSSGSGNNMAYTTPIDLPTQSSKQVTLYVYLPSHANRLAVQLVDRRGALLHAVQTNPLRAVEQESLLYGLVSSDGGRFTFLETVTAGRSSAAVANLSLPQLPDLAAALAPLDLLIFHNVDSGQLTPAQRAAVTAWVSLGGQLVVTGGPGWPQTTAGWGDLLPVTVSGSRSVADLPGLAAWAELPLRDPGPYVTAVAGLRRGELLLQDGGLPLLARQRHGRGAVYFLALDPALAPLRDWDGSLKLWAAVAAETPILPGWAAGFQRGFTAAQAAQIIPGLTLPSVWFLLFFMLGYIVLIGPANYWLVRRLKRRELAWITIPAIILLVSAGTYLAGTRLMGRGIILNELAVAFGHLESDTMRVHGLTTIYSPRRTSYDLVMPAEALVRPFGSTFFSGSGVGQGGDVAAMERDSQLIARGTRVDVGGLQSFVAEYHLPRPAISGQAALVLEPGGSLLLNVYLQNNGRWPLENGALIYADRLYPIGDLAAGATYEGRQTVTAGSPLTPLPYGPYGYYGPYGSPAANLIGGHMEQLVGGADYWNNRTLFVRYQLLEALLPDYGGSGVSHLPTGVVTLVGWSTGDSLQLPLDPGLNSFQTFSSALYFLEIPVTLTDLSAGAFTLPLPLLDWRVLDSEGLGGSWPGVTSFYLPTGQVDYEFRPTYRPDNRQLTSLRIRLASAAASGQPVPAVFLWNWTAAAWELVDDLNWGETAVVDFAPYLGPDLAIRLRLQNSSPFGYEIDAVYPLLEFN